jgi:N-6 DNA Methylase
MRLSWNEIRARAARFAEEWAGAKYEKGETQSFYNDFFEVFGVKRRKVASFEEPVKLLGDKRGFIDLFWKGVLLVEQKSAGGSLKRAKTQALDYFPGLKDAELPRYVLVSDFQTFELHDLDEGTLEPFTLAELPRKVEHFGFVLGVQKRAFKDQDPVNIEAAEIMGRLHDALKQSGYEDHDLERFLVRLVFCLFADATGIFEQRGIFLDLIEQRCQIDGSDTGRLLNELFDVLNTPEPRRQRSLDEDLAAFPYVNGQLFAERLPTAAFDGEMRGRLLEACKFSWDAISPAIFGSLFQSVMSAKERRASGAHYTTEKNILKVIEPLFLDDLRGEFERLKARRDTGRLNVLKAFHDRLATLNFFDPACGCGNFLIIAYRELRALEIEVLKEIRFRSEGTAQMFDAGTMAKVNVNQFYGIEIHEFPVRIAETALWMMDHIMNNRLSLEFGEAYARIPLKTSPHIHCADALEMDWATVLAPDQCSFVYGNPPFSGFVMRDEAKQKQAQLLMRSLGAKSSRLDYVAAWFLKAGQYVQNSRAGIGFVATNSVTQGEQVSQLWPALFDRWKLEIAFAHRTFAWGSDARGVAHVHVVVIGLTKREDEPKEKRLFSYDNIKSDPVESRHMVLSPYLFDASRLANRHLVVTRTRGARTGFPPIRVGSKPVDGGYFILDNSERLEFLMSEPDAKPYLHPFVGSDELINGGDRWIFALHGAPPQKLRALPRVMALVEKVRRYRLGQLPPRHKAEGENKKSSALSRVLARTPTEFHVTVLPTSSFLAIPEVSSERREYIPVAWLAPPTVPSNKLLVATGVSLDQFALITSKMHMAWTAYVGGRLKSDYQYSPGINYNPFPWPLLTAAAHQDSLAKLAQAVLDARAAHPAATLADLYDPNTMPPNLRKAHRALDLAVEKLYRPAPFGSDRERVEHLFGLYENLTAPLTAADRARSKRGARVPAN